MDLSMHRRWAITLLALGTLGLVGCTSKSNVQGKVTYQGKALTSGSVSIIAEDQLQYSGQIESDGSYSIPNVPTGEVKFLVSSPNPGGESRGQGRMPPKGANSDLAPAQPVAANQPKTDWFQIPEKYADPANTDLKGTVKANPSVIDLELKD